MRGAITVQALKLNGTFRHSDANATHGSSEKDVLFRQKAGLVSSRCVSDAAVMMRKDYSYLCIQNPWCFALLDCA